MVFPLNKQKQKQKKHKLFMHHQEQNFRSLPAQTSVPNFQHYLLIMNLTAHRRLKQKRPNQSQYTNSPLSPYALLTSSQGQVPNLRDCHHPLQAPKLGVNPDPVHPTSGHRTFLEFILCSLTLLPRLLLRLPSPSLNCSTRNLPTSSWLAFSPAPTPPQHCGQSNLS